mmetsp:Transcript_74769/g.207912  ORF Transcript_74769/g.207912 Transcript_74769/m.207912 type:complete len:241 (-) Transcript_74769:1873-2595(-)
MLPPSATTTSLMKVWRHAPGTGFHPLASRWPRQLLQLRHRESGRARAPPSGKPTRTRSRCQALLTRPRAAATPQTYAAKALPKARPRQRSPRRPRQRRASRVLPARAARSARLLATHRRGVAQAWSARGQATHRQIGAQCPRRGARRHQGSVSTASGRPGGQRRPTSSPAPRATRCPGAHRRLRAICRRQPSRRQATPTWRGAPCVRRARARRARAPGVGDRARRVTRPCPRILRWSQGR